MLEIEWVGVGEQLCRPLPSLDAGTHSTGPPSFLGVQGIGGILCCWFLSIRLGRGQKLQGLGATFPDPAIT